MCAQAWSYCVLDEGHAIRNPASKVAQAAKRAGLAAQHRLLLSGTPVQNNVAELWSLFDFLMPGLLGSERQFNARYGRTLQVCGLHLSLLTPTVSALMLAGLHPPCHWWQSARQPHPPPAAPFPLPAGCACEQARQRGG